MGPFVSEEFPSRKIIFRITNAIESKRAQYAKWIEDGVADPQRPFIIDVCAGALESVEFHQVSYGSRSVYGIGPTIMHIPRDPTKRAEGVRTSIKFTPEHLKVSRSAVSAGSFLTGAIPEVSGIIFTDMHLLRYINRGGQEFEIIHNLTASSPLKTGVIPIGYDVWAEEGETEFTLQTNRVDDMD